MDSALNQNLFLIKEHVELLGVSKNYDVFSPEDGQLLMTCREVNVGTFARFIRSSKSRPQTPFHIVVSTPDGQPLLEVRRAFSLWGSTVKVYDEHGDCVGSFRRKFFTFFGGLSVQNADGKTVCQVKGKWTGFNYKFEHNGILLAEVTKKWAGLTKELLTSADNYILSISETVPADNPLRFLILGSVFCIDIVLKE